VTPTTDDRPDQIKAQIAVATPVKTNRTRPRFTGATSSITPRARMAAEIAAVKGTGVSIMAIAPEQESHGAYRRRKAFPGSPPR